MRPEQIYAIVDIEATGGSVGANERIIQFACVLLQNGEVIHTFETYVNPGRNIPHNIKQLTGISNKDVRRAPYFEEVAPIIVHLLEDTVFVAHNVGFDFRFLNEQLYLHDFPTLNIPAIDTVELTQIIYPTLDSFQLEDIAASLGYDLLDAHDALADANATVYIFKELFKKATTLPLVTLEKLKDLSPSTTHETSLFFKEALNYAKNLKAQLADDLVVVNQIALKNPDYLKTVVNHPEKLNYPTLKTEKEEFLYPDYSYRKDQAEMMDLIYNYLNSDVSLEKLAIEVPPGVGKSLGYLFPAAFIATPKSPIVISTYTTVLQNQLFNESLPMIEKMFNRNIKKTLIKSSEHYLSLSVFERWLKQITAENSEAYLCMRILVWLTETTTGDLSEINAGSHLDLVFWHEIRATKNQYTDDHWKDYDFYERIKEAIKDSEIIITNHHFLAYDWKSDEPVLTNLENLIIDEAHHFSDVATQSNTISLKGTEITTYLEKMGSLANETGIFKFIYYLSEQNIIKKYDMQILARTTSVLNETWNNLYEEIIIYFSQQDLMQRKDSNYIEDEYELDFLTLKQKKWRKNILYNTEEFILTSQKIIKQAYESFDKLSVEYQLLYIELVNLTGYIKDWYHRLQHTLTFDKDSPKPLRWVSFLPDDKEHTFQLHVLKWGANNSLVDYLATHSKVVFTSSTLSFQDSEQYFSGQLKNLPMKFHQLKGPYDYGKQVKLMLPEQRIHPKEIQPSEYPKQLADSIRQILKGVKVNTIILFRSLTILKEVYEILIEDKQLMDYLFLAQSISGTRNRILKNFKRNKPAVILGADSFFEGIDLPDEELELVILTRLPFPSPNTPLTRSKIGYLKQQGIHPFMGELLPQAILKYKQAFGRLIRNETDHGVMIVLDERILSASYSKIFIEALPQGVPMEIYPNEQLGKEIQKFLNN